MHRLNTVSNELWKEDNYLKGQCYLIEDKQRQKLVRIGLHVTHWRTETKQTKECCHLSRMITLISLQLKPSAIGKLNEGQQQERDNFSQRIELPRSKLTEF